MQKPHNGKTPARLDDRAGVLMVRLAFGMADAPVQGWLKHPLDLGAQTKLDVCITDAVVIYRGGRTVPLLIHELNPP
jgi:hypothetical protein